MDDLLHHQKHLAEKGFTLISGVFSHTDVDRMIHTIEQTEGQSALFRKSADLFAIRQVLKEVPGLTPLIFNNDLKKIIQQIFGDGYFVVKSIYFDKPGNSNWFVAYHQDLTISVDRKTDLPGFGPWTVKQNQFAVQPPVNVLENIFAIRIHLDDTNAGNGALRVIPGSHAKGVSRPELIDWKEVPETICAVEKGGVMLMKPLLLHASNRTMDNRQRRVIHVELSSLELEGLNWSESLDI